MRILITLLLLTCTVGIVKADSFYPGSNPFPTQICPENYNNIYETTPAVMEKEKESAKKTVKSRWWRIRNDEQTPVEKVPVRAEDSGFIMFQNK